MVVLVKPFFLNFERFLRIKERMLYKAYDIVCSGGLTGRNVKYIHCCLEYDADYANDRLWVKMIVSKQMLVFLYFVRCRCCTRIWRLIINILK